MSLQALLSFHECNDRESLIDFAENFGVQNIDYLDQTLTTQELKRSLQNLLPCPVMEII